VSRFDGGQARTERIEDGVTEQTNRGTTSGSTPGSDDPAAAPATSLGGDALVPGSDEAASSAPGSDSAESSEQELAELQHGADERRLPDRAEVPPDQDNGSAVGVDPATGGDRELASVGAPTSRRRNGAVAAAVEPGSGAVVRARKGHSTKQGATPAQRQVAKQKRTTPAQFVREAVGELRKVVYPTGSQLANYFVVVLVFVLFIIGIVSLLDLGFGWVIFKVFS